MTDWHALLVKSGLEGRVCGWLRKYKVEAYWPRYQARIRLNRHRWGKRWHSVIPGYLFLSADFLDMDLIRRGKYWGVRSVMRNGSGDIARIRERDIDRIRLAESAMNESSVSAAQAIPFKVGQVVWLKRIEMEGIVRKIDSRKAIVVEVSMFSRIVRMVAPIEALQAK